MINDNSPFESHHFNASKHLFVTVSIQISQVNWMEPDKYKEREQTKAEIKRIYNNAGDKQKKNSNILH
jgi:hypothetical protein